MSGLRYCPRCAGSLVRRQIDSLAPSRLVCAGCGRIHYQNSKACGGVLLVRDGRALLARRAVEPRRHCWDIPGGFLEAGEHPAEGAVREAREELGVDVTLGTQLGIFMDVYDSADGPDHTMSVYYLVEQFHGEPSAHDDVEELGWFEPSELPSEMAFKHLFDVLRTWQTLARMESAP